MTLDKLSPRQRKLVNLIAQGCSNKDAAQTMGLAVSTVKNMTKSIYNRLGIHSRVILALRVRSEQA